ncbi:MAG: divergent polysaccharide deacetylase family protein [Gammaproteobacteria bacterium]|jgi:hypothetical protein|nr:divergent polysaccharide deacetylase family protein [Gammaproteobacteria bacterium]
MRNIHHFLALALTACAWLAGCNLAQAEEEPQPAMVVIIDDLGDNLSRGLGAVHLPGPVTLAIMPHTPFGPRLAHAGYQLGKEIMLHAPMENHAGLRLGPGGLTSHMDEQTFKQTLQDNIASIPYVAGINNHMGSALTELEQPMRWTMDILDKHGLFFIDSRTSANTQALRLAQERHIASQSRDVFLDNNLAPEALAKQFQQAIKTAQRQGSAILIGHTYPASITFLRKNLPQLDALGIRLVSASALLYEMDNRRPRPLPQAQLAEAIR